MTFTLPRCEAQTAHNTRCKCRARFRRAPERGEMSGHWVCWHHSNLNWIPRWW